MLTLDVTDDTGRVVQRVQGIVEGISDYTPYWAMLRSPWEARARSMYRTRGKYIGTRWPSYGETDERKWYVWKKAGILKIDIRRPGDLDRLLLDWQDMRRLAPAITNTRDPLAVWRPSANTLTVGTNVPYHKDHEFGGKRAPADWGGHAIPQRRTLLVGQPFAREMARALGDFAATAVGRTGRSGFDSRTVLGMIRRGATRA